MSNVSERRNYVRSCQAFLYTSSPGDGATRYVFEKCVAKGLTQAEQYVDAYNSGLSQGWDYANYADAYGADKGAFMRGVERHSRTAAERIGFGDGWLTAESRYRDGLFPDGAQMGE